MPERGRKSCGRGERSWVGEAELSCPSVSSYLDFYTNIPDYSDLHDLSDQEFYERLQALKETQKHLTLDEPGSGLERSPSQSSFASPNGPVRRRPASKTKPTRGRIKSPPRIVIHSPLGHAWDAKEGEVPPCDTPPYGINHHHQRDFCRSMGALSLESSGLHVHGEQCRPHSRATHLATEIERKHQVPLRSRIPLFHKIMAEQEERRRMIHERNSLELRAMVQPFSFTKKEEAAKHVRTCPSHGPHPRGRSRTPFRAKAVPAELFSERAYDRMREEQFYRALKKRIRAEQMLKAAKMPPSMEEREKVTNKGKSKSLDFLAGKTVIRRQRSRSRGYRPGQDEVSSSEAGASRHHAAWRGGSEMEASQSPCWRRRGATPTHSTAWRAGSNTDSSADASPNDSTIGPRKRARPPASTLSATRSNLASVLRMQAARSRIEGLMRKQLEEQEQLDQVRFKARLVRLGPAWRTLDYSTDEDLALRLAQRRHEARIQGQTHRRLMDAIHGRVHHIPPLFQDPVRSVTGCGYSKKEDARSKSLESSLDATGKENQNSVCQSRKTRSFYLDRKEAHKSSESSQAKSDGSKEDSCGSDFDSNDERTHSHC